jgi:hypothetical protein
LNVVRLYLFLLVLWFAGGLPFSQAADALSSVYISELLPDNQHGLEDDDGDHSGWIEIFNGSATTIALKGWFLTDSRTNLTKWRFPGVSLLPDKFLIVFASGKDRTTNPACLHANFRLDKRRAYVALIGPATNIVSELPVSLEEPSVDLAFGRARGDQNVLGPLRRPTPGKYNAVSGPGFASDISFSRPAGNFTEPFALELSSRSTGAVIRYTLDGQLPTGSSSAYHGPLAITNTARVRARAYQEGLFPGPPRSEVYVKLFTNVLSFTSTLPIVIMHTFGRNDSLSSGASPVHLLLHAPVEGRTSLTNPPTFSTRGGFRVRGSTSSGFPQSPFAVEFLDEFDQERDLSPLGLPADSNWILYAPNVYDMVMIHNPFVYQLSRDMGRYSPRTRFVEVFLAESSGPVSDAHYHGIYVLTEKIKISKHRVNINRLGTDDLKAPEVTGGYVMKFDRLGRGENGFAASDGRGIVHVEPKEAVINLPQRAAQREYLQTFFRNFNQSLNGPNWKDPILGYRAYLDVEAAIDFHVLEVLSGNVDAMVLSTYFHKPRSGRIIFGPHWDFDRALGSTDGRDADPRIWTTGPFFAGAWWPRLFSDVDFWQQWVDRWQELRETHFSRTNLNSLIDRLSEEVREAQPREYKRWNLQPRGGSYQGEIDLMKDWLSNRLDFIDQQLVQPPQLNRHGGLIPPGFPISLTAKSTNVIVYYTLDGSDPRLLQGGISSNAIVYRGPVQLQATTEIVARGYNPNQRQTGGPPLSTPWSGRIGGRFVLTRP